MCAKFEIKGGGQEMASCNDFNNVHVATTIIFINIDHCSHFLTATFDFTTYFTQAYKVAPFFHSLAVLVWIFIAFCTL